MNFLVQGLKFIILLASSLLGLKCCAVIDPTFSLSFPYCRSFSFPLFFHALETHVFTVSQKKIPSVSSTRNAATLGMDVPPKKDFLNKAFRVVGRSSVKVPGNFDRVWRQEPETRYSGNTFYARGPTCLTLVAPARRPTT